MNHQRVWLAALVALVLVVAACSGSRDVSELELVDRLPEWAESVRWADLAAVRADGTRDQDRAVAHMLLPTVIAHGRDRSPIIDAVDVQRITLAAAAVAGDDTFEIVQTRRSWQVVRQDLLDDGYTEDDSGVLTPPPVDERRRASYPAVAHRDDAIYLAFDSGILADLEEISGPPQSLIDGLEAVEGPARAVRRIGEPDASCGSIYASGLTLPSTGGQIAVLVGPDADAAQIRVPVGESEGFSRRGVLTVSAVGLDGPWLRIDFTRIEPLDEIAPRFTSLETIVESGESVAAGLLGDEYDCP